MEAWNALELWKKISLIAVAFVIAVAATCMATGFNPVSALALHDRG